MNLHLEHSDVIRVIGHSHKSFDDAVQTALHQLTHPQEGHNHHPHLKFQSFEVVKLGGYIHQDENDETKTVTHFSATLDVVGVHKH